MSSIIKAAGVAALITTLTAGGAMSASFESYSDTRARGIGAVPASIIHGLGIAVLGFGYVLGQDWNE